MDSRKLQFRIEEQSSPNNVACYLCYVFSALPCNVARGSIAGSIVAFAAAGLVAWGILEFLLR